MKAQLGELVEELGEGNLIPTERDLAERFEVARETVRQAVRELLTQQAQQEVSEIGGGFSAREDVKATDANAIALTELMDGIEVFEPDWSDIDQNLTSYVEDWKSATGS